VNLRAISGDGDAPLLFAGLWESWTDNATGDLFETYAILTRSPYVAASAVHDRSPVVLPRDRRDAWLDPTARDANAAAKVLDAPEPDLVSVAVGAEVGDVRNQGAGLVEPRSQ